MAIDLRFLRASEVEGLDRLAKKKASVIHSENMLQSAIHSPGNYQHYETENKSARLAALLSCALIIDHSVLYINKRIALLAAKLVQLQNGKVLPR